MVFKVGLVCCGWYGCPPVEVVVEAAQGVVVGDQPQLGAAVPRGAVRPDVPKDVLMPGLLVMNSRIMTSCIVTCHESRLCDMIMR